MKNAGSRDGVALIVVLFALAALAVVSVPFLISMSYQERDSARFQAGVRARMAAEAARAEALALLIRTHEHVERREDARREEGVIRPRRPTRGMRRTGSARGTGSGRRTVPTPRPRRQDVDGLEEFRIALPPRLGTLSTRDPRGTLMEASAEDEQGKIHLDSAPPILLGNLLASSYLAEQVDAGAREFKLGSAAGFRSDGDPKTIDGLVAILDPTTRTYEVASYRHRSGERLLGVARGEYLSIARRHRAGSPVFDLRGLKAALHRIYAGRGRFTPFRTIRSVRQIAEWPIVTYFLDRLWAHRITPAALARAGIRLRDLVPPGVRVPEGPAIDPAILRRSEQTLGELGFPEDLVDRLGRARGPRGVVALAESLAGLGAAEAREAVERLREELAEEIEGLRGSGGLRDAVRRLPRLWALPAAETLSAADFERIRDLVTVWSERPRAWSRPQLVLGVSHHRKTGVQIVFVRDTTSFNPGALVRVTGLDPGGRAEYRLVAGAVPLVWQSEAGEGDAPQTTRRASGGLRISGAAPRGSRGTKKREILRNLEGYVILQSPIGGGYGEGRAVIQVALRHPVNVNTAPRAVLRAIFTGLRLVGSADFVRPGEAEALAGFLESRLPLGGHAELREALEMARARSIISGSDAEAILINAVNPNHRRLAVSTTGFTYRSEDVAAIEATGIVNDIAGRELARCRIREILRFAPPGTVWRALETQDDFTWRVFRAAPASRGRWRELGVPIPGRYGRLVTSEPRVVHAEAWGFPGSTPGILTGLTAESPRLRGTVTIEHFPRTEDGLLLDASQSYTVGDPRRGTAAGTARGGAGSVRRGTSAASRRRDTGGPYLTNPMSIDFWVEPRGSSRSGRRIFFDIAADPATPFQNRATLYFDGASQEIVLAVRDDTLPWWRGPDGDPPAAGVRFRATEATFARDTWYHIGAHWIGTRPGEQALLLDGRAAGRPSLATELAGGLTADAMAVAVKDPDVAARFPPQGTLLVGSEAISYAARQGTTFTVRPRTSAWPDGRGARGTVRRDHAAGTPVSLCGYSIPVVPTGLGEGFSTGREGEGRRRPRRREDEGRILLGKGGARLSLPLGVTRRVSVNDRWQATVPEPATRASIHIGLGRHPEYAALPNAIPAGPEDPIRLGFQPRGYLHVVTWFQDPREPGSGITHHEIIRYGKIAPFDAGEEGEKLPGWQFTQLLRGQVGTSPPPVAAGGGAAGPGGPMRALAPGAPPPGGRAPGPRPVPGGRRVPGPEGEPGEGTGYGRALAMAIYGISIETGVSDLDARYPLSGLIQIDRAGGAARPVTPYLQEVEWIRYTAILEGKYFINDIGVGGWTGYLYRGHGAIFRGFTGNTRYGIIEGQDERGRPQTEDGRPIVYLQDDYEIAAITEHAAGAPIVPVFRIPRPGPEPNDRITVAEQGGDPAERRFERRTRRVRIVAETDAGIFVSLYEPLAQSYREGRDVRLKMFPSGELPSRGAAGIVFGRGAVQGQGGALQAVVDEIRVTHPMPGPLRRLFAFPAAQGGFRLRRTGQGGAAPGGAGGSLPRAAVDTTIDRRARLGPGAARLRLVLVAPEAGGRSTAWARGEGLLKIDREVFFYRAARGRKEERGGGWRPGLAQPLSRDWTLDAGEEAAKIALARSTRRGYPAPPRPARDLRAELIPQIQIQSGGGLPDRDGFVEIEGGWREGEIIYYDRRTGNVLRNCLRGQLGSPIRSYAGYAPSFDENTRRWRRREIHPRLRPISRAEVELLARGLLWSEPALHEPGERATMPLAAVPSALLLGPVSERSIPVSRREGFPRQGYVVVDDGRRETPGEILAYVGLGTELLPAGRPKAGGRAALERAIEDRRRRGIFRGSFGTQPMTGWPGEVPVIALPFRHFDRYEPRAESPAIALYETSFTRRGAYWKRVTWELDATERTWPRHQVRVVVRLDGAPAWDAPATNEPGGLYLFTDPRGENRIGRVADTVEVRVYFRYLPGAYGPVGPEVFADDWKMSPRVRDIVLEYERPVQVVEHEELVP